jgi:crotonobetainyl-CoA:carnitine CoA-transferase CaiB-like acyl-CoA transferase
MLATPVYVSSSGFGQTGPYKGRPAYDPVIQATSGLTSVQADENGRPKLMRVIIPDLTTALTSAQAIAVALVQRERTGHGSHIEVSMLDTIISWSWPEAYHQVVQRLSEL